MANKTIKHFVIIRFFPYQGSRFPHDVLDINFLATQLPLAKNNGLRSLENQTSKNFELIFLMNDKYFLDKKYEFIFTELKASVTVPVRFVKDSEMPSLFEEAYNKYDFVIQTRIDFDDFVFKGAVADTQNKVNECNDILSYGYCKGYTYIYGELFSFYGYVEGSGHHSTFPSLILKSSFAKKIPYVSIYRFPHALVHYKLKEFLESNGIEFSESMFQQNHSIDAFIYYRHEASQQLLVTNTKLQLPKRKPLTTANVTKKKLEEEFGFYLPLKSIKNEEADFNYDFTSTQAEEFGFSQDLTSIKYL